jgi:hypothetical protein
MKMKFEHPELETVDYWEIMKKQIWKAVHPALPAGLPV